MNNNRGQALIEFILILPIIIILILGMIDIGRIYITKYELLNTLDDLVLVSKDVDRLNEKIVTVTADDPSLRIKLTDDNKLHIRKTYQFITPGVNLILSPYYIEVSRAIYEQ